MTDKIKTFTIVIGDGAYTSERPYTMLRFAFTSLLEGHKINIFLVEDGVFVGKKNQNPSSYDNVEKWLK
ncbi:MAG: DsrE family protein, partial [Promethearchaeota archaeon]